MTTDKIDYRASLAELQKKFKMRPFLVDRPTDSEYPELFIRVPNSWPSIQIAPFYDVHVGNPQCDEDKVKRHLEWLAETPNVIAFNGGDMFENLVNPKMGHTPLDNTEAFYRAVATLAPYRHKFAFAIPGNHEDRSYRACHLDSARLLADNLDIPYFQDYCFTTIMWKGMRFKIAAHHGTGAAQTAGAQRMAARKDLAWSKPDILWTGHLHKPLTDTVTVMDYDQQSGRMFERDIFVIISPSYVKYFGSYASKMRLGPGSRGLTVATLQDDGRIDVTLHAQGKRL